MSVRSVFPLRAAIQSATPADRTPRRSSSVVRVRACSRACARASVACLHAGAAQRAARRKERRPAEKEGGNPEQEKGAARALRGHRGWWERRVRSCIRKKELRVCCVSERTEGSGSGACGVVRAATSFLHGDPVYQQAVDARASGCIGVGGDARGCVRRCRRGGGRRRG